MSEPISGKTLTPGEFKLSETSRELSNRLEAAYTARDLIKDRYEELKKCAEDVRQILNQLPAEAWITFTIYSDYPPYRDGLAQFTRLNKGIIHNLKRDAVAYSIKRQEIDKVTFTDYDYYGQPKSIQLVGKWRHNQGSGAAVETSFPIGDYDYGITISAAEEFEEAIEDRTEESQEQ